MRGRQILARRTSQRQQTARCAWGTAGLLLLVLSGCPAPRGAPQPETDEAASSSLTADRPLRLLVVDDRALAEVARREWQAQSDLPLEVTSWDGTQLAAWLVTEARPAERGLPLADAIIYPAGFLGALIEREGLARLPRALERDPDHDLGRQLPLLRADEVRWGGEAFAISLGAAPFVVAYRTDGLPAEAPPHPLTWPEFHDWLQNLSLPGASATAAHRLLQPLGEAWAGTLLLARATAYVRDTEQISALFDYQSMEPLIDRAPFVRALEEMVADSDWGPAEQLEWGPADVLQRLLAGRAAAAITWLADADPADAVADFQLGVFELPGSAESYRFGDATWIERRAGQPPQVPLLGMHGRLASVSSASRRQRWAWQLLRHLTRGDTGVRVSAASAATAPAQPAQLTEILRWTGEGIDPSAAREYAALLVRCYDRHVALTGPRLPGYADYLAALNSGVHRALRRERTAAAALAEVAEAWRAILGRHGREASRAAYARSLGHAP